MKKHVPRIIFLVVAGTILYALLTIEGYKYFTKEQKQEQQPPATLEEILKDEEWKKDGCEGNAECKSCKREIKCQKCMSDCYNRHGYYTQKDNPRREKAILCNKNCWEAIYWESPDIDFGIPPIKKSK